MKKLFRGFYERDDLDHFIEGLAVTVQETEKLLKDNQRCLFVPVMLAEALCIEETRDLIRELRRRGIGITDVIINRLYPESKCLLCRHIRSHQVQELARIFGEPAFSDLRFWGIPMVPQEIRGRKALRSFWKAVREVAPSPGEAQAAPASGAPARDQPDLLAAAG